MFQALQLVKWCGRRTVETEKLYRIDKRKQVSVKAAVQSLAG